MHSFDRRPPVREAIARSGLSTREFCLFLLSTVEAQLGAYLVELSGWHAVPEEISREKIEFYLQHRETFAKLDGQIQALTPPGS